MSIVGPRPHALAHNEIYKDAIHTYMQRHRVKPGITGWAQVNGWRGETDTLAKMQKRVEYDLYYINNWSLEFDLKIIFLTLFRGFINLKRILGEFLNGTTSLLVVGGAGYIGSHMVLLLKQAGYIPVVR